MVRYIARYGFSNCLWACRSVTREHSVFFVIYRKLLGHPC